MLNYVQLQVHIQGPVDLLPSQWHSDCSTLLFAILQSICDFEFTGIYPTETKQSNMVNDHSLTDGLHSFATALHMKPFQGLIWFTGWSAWTLASLQFYLLPFTLSNIATYLHVEQSKISEVNTYTMLSRSLGAIVFGVLSDQYGRKIPLLIDLVFLGVLTLASGFIHTYAQLIGVRFLFGKSMPCSLHCRYW
jgi:hypothetical protein